MAVLQAALDPATDRRRLMTMICPLIDGIDPKIIDVAVKLCNTHQRNLASYLIEKIWIVCYGWVPILPFEPVEVGWVPLYGGETDPFDSDPIRIKWHIAHKLPARLVRQYLCSGRV